MSRPRLLEIKKNVLDKNDRLAQALRARFLTSGIYVVNLVSSPGTGKTATARLWAYGRDERPWGSDTPPASWYQFSPDRKGQHPKHHLARYQGWMHADGYAGFEDIYRSGDIREVACMAHVRRKFVDIHRAQGSAIADEAIARHDVDWKWVKT